MAKKKTWETGLLLLCSHQGTQSRQPIFCIAHRVQRSKLPARALDSCIPRRGSNDPARLSQSKMDGFIRLHCIASVFWIGVSMDRYGLFWLKPERTPRASCRCVRCFLDAVIRCASSATTNMIKALIGSWWNRSDMDPWSVNSCELRHALHMSYRAALEPNERFQRLLKHTERRVRRVRIYIK